MPSFVLVQGDQVVFEPAFGDAKVTVQTGTLSASGVDTINQKSVCVFGDQAEVMVGPCPYETDTYLEAGMGMLSIQQLAPDQQSGTTTSNNQPVLVQGSQFTALFTVIKPAQAPPPANTPDPLKQYTGQGTFQTTNTIVKA